MALYTMKEILADAQAKNYGVGFFNTFKKALSCNFNELFRLI